MQTKIRVLDRRVVRSGEMLFEQGEIGNRAYFIEKGKVEVFRKDRHGNIVVIAEISAGSVVGEMAIVNNDFRTASVRAVEDSVLVGISAADLKKALSKTDAIFQALMKIMVERLKKSNEQLYRQYTTLMELEETARQTLDGISGAMRGDASHEHLKREVLPVLDRLKSTLARYDYL